MKNNVLVTVHGWDCEFPHNLPKMVILDLTDEFGEINWSGLTQGEEEMIESYISDRLSDAYDFCHFGFGYKTLSTI